MPIRTADPPNLERLAEEAWHATALARHGLEQPLRSDPGQIGHMLGRAVVALSAMEQNLRERSPGRPANPSLRRQVEDLHRELRIAGRLLDGVIEFCFGFPSAARTDPAYGAPAPPPSKSTEYWYG